MTLIDRINAQLGFNCFIADPITGIPNTVKRYTGLTLFTFGPFSGTFRQGAFAARGIDCFRRPEPIDFSPVETIKME